jgi:hypothetical protein
MTSDDVIRRPWAPAVGFGAHSRSIEASGAATGAGGYRYGDSNPGFRRERAAS